MSLPLDRFADSAARRLLERLSRGANAETLEWVNALKAESEYVESGWQRFRWALGGVSLVWTINRSRLMRKRPEVVALVLLVLLTALAAAQQLIVIPVIRAMLVQARVFVSLPARIFLHTSQYGALAFLAFVVLTLVALRRLRPAGDRAQQASIMNVASILMVLYILGQASVVVDLARSASKVMQAGRQTSSIGSVR